MKLAPFALERYFAEHEFSARYLLSSSDCDGLPLRDVLAMADDETRALWDQLRLGYTESLGLPLLRREIAGLYKGIDASDVLVAAPEEAIFIAMNCLLDKGDHVVCTYPGYQSLHEIAVSLGCAVDRWEPEESRGWEFDPVALKKLLKPSTKLLVVNFPHNPTGALPSAAVWREIMELARERGIHVFSDEMYRFLEVDAAGRLPPACELYDKAVTLFGMSKTFGLAGLRIGWLVTKDSGLYARMARFKDYTTICSAAPSEVLALIGLRAKDRIIAAHRERLASNLSLLDAFFERQAGCFRWTRPRGGTIGFPRLLHGDPARLCAQAVEKAGVMLSPASVFGYDQPHVRVGFGRANMPEALDRLEKFLPDFN